MINSNKRPTATKASLIIRLIAGMYLIYLAYELLMGLGTEGAPKALVIGAAVIFAVFGIVLALVSGKDFLKGNFQGGIMDVQAIEDSSENE